MKNKLLLFAIISLFCSCTPKIDYAQNSGAVKEREVDGFVFGTADIPLLAGLEIVEEESTNFDTFSGNISVAVYFGSMDLQEAKDFYSRTLPQIGFRIDDTLKDDIKMETGSKVDTEQGSDIKQNIKYVRENDTLELSFEQKGERLYIKFITSSK